MTTASAYPPGSEQNVPEGRASEPSMEDILASIRRIIADDQQSNGSRSGARRTVPPAVTIPEPPTEAHAVAGNQEALDLARFGDRAEPADAVGISDADHAHAAPPEGSMHPDAEAVDGEDAPAEIGEHVADAESYGHHDLEHAGGHSGEVSLLAPPMGESVMSAFEALAATVVLENKPMLEGILRDLLRPMLKAWLDDNLPSLVERLVRIEIERVARGGRG